MGDGVRDDCIVNPVERKQMKNLYYTLEYSTEWTRWTQLARRGYGR
jgi:hypothetical protein